MTGRCLCGGVAFELEPPLRDVLVCHCSVCRRQGTLAGAYTSVTADRLRLTADSTLSWYRDVNDRERGFCSRCGSTLFWRSSPAAVSVSAGALDGDDLVVGGHIFVESAAAWESVPRDAPHRDDPGK